MNEESEFIHNTLWNIFSQTFYDSKKLLWPQFIKESNIGLECKWSDPCGGIVYKIVDEKQWLITKMKYGI
jgi:hypothetical protein